MDIEFYCFKCGQPLVVDATGAGKPVNCPKCQVELVIPTARSDSKKERVTPSSEGGAPAPQPRPIPAATPPVISQTGSPPPVRARSMSNRKIAVLVILIIAAVVFVLIASVAVFTGMFWVGTAPIRMHNKAQNDVNVIYQALNAYVSEQNELPRGSFSTICRLLRGESVDGQNLKRLDYLDLESGGVDVNTKGEILDPWGIPYRIILDKQLRVYSCGPNKIDEQGNGDDIHVNLNH